MKNMRCLFVVVLLFLLAGCNGQGILDFEREITIKESIYGDTVYTSLVIRNRSNDTLGLTVIPECDCTVVFPESVQLKPRSRQKVKIAYYVNTVSYYEKMIYLECEKTGVIDTVVIRGNVQK